MNLDDAPWDMIPAHCQAGLRRYIEDGIKPGDFLYAVITNNLRRAVEKADEQNRAALSSYVTFLFNYAPAACFGSAKVVGEWIERGGLNGMDRKRETEKPSEAA